jgi:hypothetical protein
MRNLGGGQEPWLLLYARGTVDEFGFSALPDNTEK